ncbi:hypothetical protein Pint_07005 [Pistacia integerrima]|uniref:Uncharacterized protein n=1 Tax=Pistacia integerrima TaxID=434235 RepID=A0ACC0XWH3_9ROSI|nr:hypothetical protein Pint_07005 [Pistacia integerrima]
MVVLQPTEWGLPSCCTFFYFKFDLNLKVLISQRFILVIIWIKLGLPQDSVRAITSGLPLFLYRFKAVSFGGSNIEPIAWEDKKCRGESRFLAQHLKKLCYILKRNAKNTLLLSLFSFVCVKKGVRK